MIAETAAPADGIAKMPGVQDFTSDDGEIRFEVDGEQTAQLMRELATFGVRSIVAHPPTLEQLLMRHYGEAAPIGNGGRERTA